MPKFKTAYIAVIFTVTFETVGLAQQGIPSYAGTTSGQPMVIHIHHHHYAPYSTSPGAEMASYYAPRYAWNFGYQPATGMPINPMKLNWGHLGFTGYLGQHGGGVDITPDSFPVFTGLVVDTVTPGSPASKIGLISGDFILKINGTAVDSYKQVAILFEEVEQGSQPEIDLTVWNPHTRRTSELKAVISEN